MMIAQLDALYLRIRPWKLWGRLVSYALFEGRPLTTRGRWINPLVFVLFAFAKRLPLLRKVRKPIFILGTGRSGTTVLGMVLSMHREVGFLNEPKAMWHALHGGEDLIGSYTRGPASYRIGSDAATIDCIRGAHRLFGVYLAAVFSGRVVDKYPELIFRVPFVKAIFPDAKFLFLVRNGWDTCHSIQGWSARLGGSMGEEVHDWWGADRRKWNLLLDQIVPEHADLLPHVSEMRGWTSQIDMAAVEWIVTMREGLALLWQYPSDVLRVDYEKLCASSREQLDEMKRFAELTQDESFMRYGIETLKPVEGRGAFELHPAIVGPFRETMAQLGYA